MTEPMPLHDQKRYARQADRRRIAEEIARRERELRAIIEAHKARRVW